MLKFHVQLHCLQGTDKGKKWDCIFINNKTIVIGRVPGCHILLSDSTVSQSQCLIQIQEEKLCVIDMGSSFGTKLNERRIQGATPLKNKDCLHIGNSILQLVWVSS